MTETPGHRLPSDAMDVDVVLYNSKKKCIMIIWSKISLRDLLSYTCLKFPFVSISICFMQLGRRLCAGVASAG